MSKQHAFRMIDAAEVVHELKKSPMGYFLPSSERQARELAKLESPEQRAEVWQEIVTEAANVVEELKTGPMGVILPTTESQARDSGSPKNRLYRRDYDTFEDYLKGRWGFTKARASQLITAACAVSELKRLTKVNLLPAHETHVRELTKLESPEQRAEVWQEIVNEAEESYG